MGGVFLTRNPSGTFSSKCHRDLRNPGGGNKVFLGGHWIKAHKGDNLRVEKSEPHTFRNHSGRSALVYNTHQPAMDYEGFFCGLHNFSRSGLVKEGEMSYKAFLGIATLYSNYSNEIVSVKPPAYVFNLLNFVGKRMGIDFK